MVLSLREGRSALALETTSSPLSPLPTFFSAFKVISVAFRALHSLAPVDEVLTPAATVTSIVPAAVTTRKVPEGLALWMIPMLPG